MAKSKLKSKPHYFWVVEERCQSDSDDLEWRPTGDDEGAYCLFGTRKWARIWKRSDYNADPKNLRVRKYIRAESIKEIL